MESLPLFLLIAVIVGIIMVVAALISLIRDNDTGGGRYNEADNAIKAIDASIQEADIVIDELGKLSNSITEEINNKYQELLFLYNLIDEKKQELYVLSNNKLPSRQNLKTDILINDNYKKPYSHPKLKEINSLYNEGISLPEIAKQLNMGQGEVKLILELNRKPW